MDRKKTTEFLSQLLISNRLSGRGKYWSREISVDYGTKDVKRVDFVQFEPAGKQRGEADIMDLINRTNLKDRASEYCLTEDEYRRFCKIIDEEPTAYDVDKVVKQLEKLKSQVPVNRILDNIIKDKPKELGQLIAYNKAIEIVKGGEIDG